MAEEKTERIYTIPLKDAYKAPRTVRARKAMTYLKYYLKKHLKTEDFSIGPGLNHEVWARGIKKPPKRVKIVVSKEEEKFKVELFGYKPKVKKEKVKKKKKEELKKEEKKAAKKKPDETAEKKESKKEEKGEE